MLDQQRTRAILEQAAHEQRTVTYGEVLAHFGVARTRSTVEGLASDLMQIGTESERRDEPLLCAVVVHRSDALPGHNFFELLTRLRGYNGPMDGPYAREVHQAELDRVWAYWKDRPGPMTKCGSAGQKK